MNYITKKRKLEEVFGKESIEVVKYVNDRKISRFKKLKLILEVAYAAVFILIAIVATSGMFLICIDNELLMALGLLILLSSGVLKVVVLNSIGSELEDISNELEYREEIAPQIEEIWLKTF